MGENKLRIGKTEYDLGDVVIDITDRAEADRDLEFDLFCDCQNLTKPGFALNCITVPGLRKWSDLEGCGLTLGSDDDCNDLLESVICEPGVTLNLARLRVDMGRFADDGIPVSITALCERSDREGVVLETGIQVSGVFDARAKVRRPYAS